MEPQQVVCEFLHHVRAGARLDMAERLMFPSVKAHQVRSLDPVTIERTPAEYVSHVLDLTRGFDRVEFNVDELFAAGDKVYARWTLHGITGHDRVVETASAVYRVLDGKIAEYWIQLA